MHIEMKFIRFETTRNQVVLVKRQEVTMIESFPEGTIIHTSGGSIRISLGLEEVKSKLEIRA